MKRTTLDLEDDIFMQLKKRSLEEGKTLKGIINTSLRNYLGNMDGKREAELHWKTYRCGRSKIMLNNREALFSKMEE